MLAGVAAGLALHLGVPVLAVRLALVLLAFVGGVGVLLYAALWLTLPVASSPAGSIGEQTASRLGLRTANRQASDQESQDSPVTAGLLISTALVALGAILLLDLSVGRSSLWPLVIVALGAALVWQQAEERHVSWASGARILVGVLILSLGLLLVIAGRGDVSALLDGLFVVIVVLLGVGILAGPWVLRLLRDLAEERRERILSQERADVAAHLHDSVLQTLAVIQQRAEDAREVARLARAQERDLRRWLYRPGPQESALEPALSDLVAWVEDDYGVAVDSVVVGDVVGVDPAVAQTVLAALREALVNAAKHAGTAAISVYVEVDADHVHAFVRDRGSGFDIAAVPADRQGVRGSIVERVRRHGGEAEVRSEVGVGTQVHIRMPRGTP
jgi:signal transduction histidine kinase